MPRDRLEPEHEPHWQWQGIVFQSAEFCFLAREPYATGRGSSGGSFSGDQSQERGGVSGGLGRSLVSQGLGNVETSFTFRESRLDWGVSLNLVAKDAIVLATRQRRRTRSK